MSKTISQALDAAPIGMPNEDAARDPQKTVKGLFMLFHGWYGNLFLSRFESGDKDKAGRDRGTLSAMVIWQSELERFDGEIVRAAADRCKVDHPKYPPTLPEFSSICRALQPRAAHRGPFKIEMSGDLKSSYTARARAQAMATYRARVNEAAGVVRTDEGVNGLLVLVAKAVGLAGGDEVATLRRLEWQAPAQLAAGQGA